MRHCAACGFIEERSILDYEYYRDLYDEEWARRDEIRQAVSFPSGVLTLLAGVLVFYSQTYGFPTGSAARVFVAAMAVAGVAFMSSVYFLSRSLFGPKYKRIPWPSELRDFQEGLIAYYHGQAGGEAAAREEWERFLVDRYVDATNRNASNNANAGEYLYKANRAVIVALVATAVAAGPVVLDARAGRNMPQRIEITNLGVTGMTKDNTQGGGQPASAPATPPPQPQQQTKPVAPANVEIRTGTQAPATKRGGGE